MGNRVILATIIVGIAIMLTFSVIPADARHPNNCPNGLDWEEVSVFPPGTDRNNNGKACFSLTLQLFIDDHIHRN